MNVLFCSLVQWTCKLESGQYHGHNFYVKINVLIYDLANHPIKWPGWSNPGQLGQSVTCNFDQAL